MLFFIAFPESLCILGLWRLNAHFGGKNRNFTENYPLVPKFANIGTFLHVYLVEFQFDIFDTVWVAICLSSEMRNPKKSSFILYKHFQLRIVRIVTSPNAKYCCNVVWASVAMNPGYRFQSVQELLEHMVFWRKGMYPSHAIAWKIPSIWETKLLVFASIMAASERTRETLRDETETGSYINLSESGWVPPRVGAQICVEVNYLSKEKLVFEIQFCRSLTTLLNTWARPPNFSACKMTAAASP